MDTIEGTGFSKLDIGDHPIDKKTPTNALSDWRKKFSKERGK